MDGLTELRAAVHALYSPQSDVERLAADAWLRSFVGQDGAWQSLVALLASAATQPDERYFAATSLRLLCLKQKGVTEPDVAQPLALLLAEQLAAAAAAGCWHTGNQLAAALATLAVRTPIWPEAEVVPQLLAVVQTTQQVAHVGAEEQQMALLRVLTCLAEAACSRDVGMHPQRREALRGALLEAPQPLAAVQQVLSMAPNVGGSGSGACTLAVQAAGLQLLQAWCVLGVPPAGAAACAALWDCLHRAALLPELGSAAAEAVAALYGSCCCPPSSPDASNSGNAPSNDSGSGGGSGGPAQRQLLSLLLGLLPGRAGFESALQAALEQAQGQAQRQAQLLFAGLTVLGAAARAADSQRGAEHGAAGGGAAAGTAEAAAAAAAGAHAVHLAAEVALAALQHPQTDVALAGLEHLDEQLERWKEYQTAEAQQAQQAHLPQQQYVGACTPQQRHALVARLCGALLQRMALPASLPPASTTADARDLPDAVQLVRREVADTFRAAADCLGLHQTRQQVLQLASEALTAWQAAGAASKGWQDLECCLYALNLIWSRSWQRSHQQQQEGEAAAEVLQVAAVVAAALQPSAPKLAGTALTLLGGMAEQLSLLLVLPLPLPPTQHQAQQQHTQQQQQQGEQQLERLLGLLLQLVQLQGDEKLSRNAATCCYRLTGHHQLAAALAARHPGWGDALCSCFVRAGGMQQRAQHGDDLTTAQFLLVSVCHLAAADAAGPAGEVATSAAQHPSGSGSSSNSGGGLGGSAAQLLQQLLSQPAAAADAALTAAAHVAGGSEQQWHLMEQAAVQVETIAVALETVTGGGASSSGGMQQQLPSLLNELSGVLQQASAAAAGAGSEAQQAQGGAPHHCHPPQQHHALLQAVCRVVAAAAGTPAAGAAIHLLHPFVPAPPHPAVLLTLAQVASAEGSAGSINGGSSGVSEHLPAAISSSLCSAAGQHAADPDWQPAILQLGQACLQHLPAVAAEEATLGALLSTADHSMRSYHREVCEQVLLFAEALCCIGCALPRQQQAQGGGSRAAAGSAVSPPPLQQQQPPAGVPQQTQQAVQHLQQRLDAGGLGVALLLGLLLAAAGGMPPYMMVLIADALHRTWRAVGDTRFGGWLHAAALQQAPEGAPWRSWKAEAQAAAVAELLSPQCAQDPRRFKRLLKVFCGGKKKGQHTEQPARAR